MVFASTQNADEAKVYDDSLDMKVYRWQRRVMLPSVPVARRMQEIIRREHIDVVWFGAAAPLALLAPAARRAGASRIVASTHGHEVGWAMLPIARQLLRRIGNHCDVITYISQYTLGRIRGAIGARPEYVRLPSGVDIHRFHPAADQQGVRSQLGWSNDLVVLCTSRLVARKGQDSLMQVWPQVKEEFPNARLVIVGSGPYQSRLRAMRASMGSVARSVSMPGRVSEHTMEKMLQAADVFAMPCRTRGYGLDVEGLGIVFLEAQASGLPVVAGDSGGAPETVPTDVGVVVSGKDLEQLANALRKMLADGGRRKACGAAGRRHVEQAWTWEIMGAKLRSVLGFG
ncbi:GDP-mannose-dependent alpha-(1-6)-phosphatidylinositol monomannoside mannosyltransferase [Corynebacterium gerontici]|uniref:GDP-mannose-dependent alpha-(1-6)-phosphatidylinositol monomannoside mannosyltransferase n=1 Tax=Corynebacterium gerontici TaxID=2079234 RepID=A0A3G6J191_9CORY|nr:GDP-mannose-dependent alpha-(1-6)-phosphatidylinositol monomannoside mannosyltransferase [Corynebacterium gerontici]